MSNSSNEPQPWGSESSEASAFEPLSSAPDTASASVSSSGVSSPNTTLPPQGLESSSQSPAFTPPNDAKPNKSAARSPIWTWVALGLFGVRLLVWGASSFHTSQQNKGIDIYNKGIDDMDKGNSSQAISEFTQATQSSADNSIKAKAYMNRGVVYFRQKDNAKALSDFNQAVALDDKLANAYYNRGLVENRLAQYAKAQNDFDEADAIKPGDADVSSQRARTYTLIYNKGVDDMDADRTSQAIGEFTQVTKSDAENSLKAEAYLNRGVIYMRQKDNDKALSDLNQATALNSKWAEPYYNRGLIALREDQYPKAVTEFSQAAVLKPSDAEVYNGRASAYTMLKQYGNAWDDIKRSRALGGKPDEKLARSLEDLSKGKN